MSEPVPYGYDVTYETIAGEILTCHYVGSLTSVRRKTMLRPNARSIVNTIAMTLTEYERAFGTRTRRRV